MEIEKIDGLDKCTIGNWTTDVFGSHYDTKLPLPTLRAISGYDSRRGRFIHPCSGFYGDTSHAHVPGLLFPWVDDTLLKTEDMKHDTVYRILSLMKNLRRVILQDAAVMIANDRRNHYISTKFKHNVMTNK